MNHKRFFRLNILIFGYPNLKDELWVIESVTGRVLKHEGYRMPMRLAPKTPSLRLDLPIYLCGGCGYVEIGDGETQEQPAHFRR